MLYNYFDDGGHIGTIVYSLLLCLMTGLIVRMIISAIKEISSKGIKNVYADLAVRGVVILVILVLSFFMGGQLIQSIEYYYEYVTETYGVISGKLENVKFELSDGRGEFYVVTFKVNDLDFNDNNISTSSENAESIKSCENQEVTVYYKIENDQQFVYKIELADK